MTPLSKTDKRAGPRLAPDESFRFGGPASTHSANCCGKPHGCTNTNPACLYLRHPYKLRVLKAVEAGGGC